MPSSAVIGVVYCALIAAISLVGGWAPLAGRLTHKRLELLVSLAAGAMLGVALLHLLPHAVLARAEAGADHAHGAESIEHSIAHDLQPVLLWLLAGFLA